MFFPFSFLTPGAWLAGFIKSTTIHCSIQTMKALGHVVSEKKIFMFSMTPPGAGPVFNPGVRFAGFYEEDHYTLLHTKYESSGPCGFREDDFYGFYEEDHYTLLNTKYESSGPCGFREDDFYVFPIVSLWKLMTPGRGHFIPHKHGWQTHYTFLHTKYESSGPFGFGEDFFFLCFFPMKPPRRGLYGPQGHGWQDLYKKKNKKHHYTLLHTQYESSGPCGFRVDLFMFFLL